MKKRSKNINQKEKKWNLFAICGFILSFLSWFSILGIALCIVGLIETKKKKQRGRVLAIVGLIIGIIVLISKSYNTYFF
jgi:cytochrome c biogenesis protein CcdA